MGLNILEGGRVMNLGDKIDKGYAVNKILKLTRNKLKSKIHTIAVGDNSNDLSMLNVSEYPCVIGNKNLKIKNKNNHFTEKHILHMIKNIRENYPPSLWNTIYQLSKKGHLNEYLNGDGDAKKTQ